MKKCLHPENVQPNDQSLCGDHPFGDLLIYPGGEREARERHIVLTWKHIRSRGRDCWRRWFAARMGLADTVMVLLL